MAKSVGEAKPGIQNTLGKSKALKPMTVQVVRKVLGPTFQVDRKLKPPFQPIPGLAGRTGRQGLKTFHKGHRRGTQDNVVGSHVGQTSERYAKEHF